MKKKQKTEENKLRYVEPVDYFPREILEKYFPEIVEEESRAKNKDNKTKTSKPVI